MLPKNRATRSVCLKNRSAPDRVGFALSTSHSVAKVFCFRGIVVLARVHSGTLIGIEAYPIEVEVDVYPGNSEDTILNSIASARIK